MRHELQGRQRPVGDCDVPAEGGAEHAPAGVDNNAVREMLNEFEGAPLQAAMKYGKLSGRCCSCGRELTNDGSIELGIGPICAEKFA